MKTIRLTIIILAVALLTSSRAPAATDAVPSRPHITGLSQNAHLRLHVPRRHFGRRCRSREKILRRHPRLPRDLARGQEPQATELGPREDARRQRVPGVHALLAIARRGQTREISPPLPRSAG